MILTVLPFCTRFCVTVRSASNQIMPELANQCVTLLQVNQSALLFECVYSLEMEYCIQFDGIDAVFSYWCAYIYTLNNFISALATAVQFCIFGRVVSDNLAICGSLCAILHSTTISEIVFLVLRSTFKSSNRYTIRVIYNTMCAKFLTLSRGS